MFFGGGSPGAPPPPPPPPTIDAAEVANQAAATRRANRNRKGLSVLAGETPPSPDLVAQKNEQQLNKVLG